MLEIFTTVANQKQCKQIANALVKEKLTACVSFWKISSVYKWKGKVHAANEWMLLVKTSEKLGKKAEAKLREMHSYEMPVVVVSRVKTDKKVEKWLKQS
ncbi:MAG: divalent-cation tolerance protein CutA [Candidatus Micrarchaeota archaeon]